jgi:hypothetical protein
MKEKVQAFFELLEQDQHACTFFFSQIPLHFEDSLSDWSLEFA